MNELPREIAAAILDGSIVAKWWFYAIIAAITAVGAAIGTFATTVFSERLKGRISKEVWYTQESWREKHKLYMAILEAVEQVFQAAASVQADTRTLSAFPPDRHSTIEDGLALFPDHRSFIEAQQNAMSRLVQLSIGSELFLSKEANAAAEALRGTYVRITHVVNMSYRARESALAIAAGEVKTKLLVAAKDDLRV